jgi:hypothetical protein
MSEENTDVQATEAPVTEVTDAVAETRFDFVLDKYRAEGRSEEEALHLQAKSYTDLQSKFGAFEGAPDEYQANLSDELVEAGAALEADDPLLTAAMEYAKESNMSQKGFDGLINLYAQAQLAEDKAMDDYKAEQMKALDNAANRIDGINKWVDANMDAETAEQLRGLIQSADGVKAVEQMIALTQNAPVAPNDAAPAPSITEREVSEMQFAKDEHGNRRIATDPAFRAEYERKRDQLYGTHEHRMMVG